MPADTPNHLIKFIKPSDRRYFKDGTLKFGTLKAYQGSEEVTLGARDDYLEGGRSRSLTFTNKEPINAHGMIFGAGANFRGLQLIDEINAHVFCCSNGPYTKEMHDGIRLGKGDYTGNAELTDYVVFDSKKLIYAVVEELSKLAPNQTENILAHGRVMYTKTVEPMSEEQLNCPPESFGLEQAFEAVITKPELFTPENEYRLIPTLHNRLGIEPDADSLFLTSDAIRDAIIYLGALG
ncbi:hypothetical protein [Shimia sp. MIT910701]|uniref:hypothetical protein n=1 Tax=Shimia sp. MIT910701 TaxID=3096987 RepID=UPI00399C0046